MAEQEKIEDIFAETINDQSAGPDEAGVADSNGEEAKPERRMPAKNKAVAAVFLMLAIIAGSSAAYYFINKGNEKISLSSIGSVFKKAENNLFKGEENQPQACQNDIIECEGGQKLNRQPPDCRFPECPPQEKIADIDAKGSGELIQEGSDDYALMLDKKRISDIIRLRSALLENFEKTGAYPRSVKLESPLSVLGGKILLAVPADSSASSSGYRYRSIKDDFFALFFNLDSQYDGIGPGMIIATPQSAGANFIDADRDGLEDSEEEAYRTSKDKPDSDGDGWSDLVELETGNDPLKIKK